MSVAQEDKRQAAIRLYDAFTHGAMDRRTFMSELTRVGGGAAAASALLAGIPGSASAAPLVADDDRRIEAAMVSLPVAGDRRIMSYRVRPRGAADRPAVIVVHENRGLTPHIRDVARRVALAGYEAHALDFLTPAGGTPTDEDRAREMIGALDLPQAVADGAAVANILSGGGRKVGITGFCWGGMMVHRITLASGADIAGGVSFYGPAPAPTEAARLQSPVLVLLAERDDRVNSTAGPYLDAAQAAGKDVRAVTYPGTEHAFHNDTSTARYNREAAEAAWRETLAFFAQHLS